MMNRTSNPRLLKYYAVWGSCTPSFDIADSDSSINQLFQRQIVGTLVKYVALGRFAPSLAKKWEISRDWKVWRFQLHDGLICDDGILVNNVNFKMSLLQSLRSYIKNGSVPTFDKITGWDSFSDGENDIKGIELGNGNEIIFNFKEPVTSGLLEYLAMPYFGYICEENRENGVWRDKKRIVASGAYRLKSNGSGDFYELELRKEWQIASAKSPRNIQIRFLERGKDVPKELDHSIVDWTPLSNADVPSCLRKIRGVPNCMLGVIFNIHKGSPLSDLSVRRSLRNLIIANTKKVELQSTNGVIGNSVYAIYPFSGSADQTHEAAPLAECIKRPLLIRSSVLPLGSHAAYVEVLLKKTLDEAEVGYIIDNSEICSVNDLFDNKFDIRIGGVDSGSEIENWVVRMMFCSPLGVRFPDPSGRVCDMTVMFDQGKITREDYIKQFNRIVYEDAAVIPLLHSGQSWFVTDDIFIQGLSPISFVDNFEDIEVD